MNGARLYVRAGMKARSDSPSIESLEAAGWTLDHVDPRYGTGLLYKAEAPKNVPSPLPDSRGGRLPLDRRRPSRRSGALGGLAPRPRLALWPAVLALLSALLVAGALRVVVLAVAAPDAFDGAGEVVTR